jgi:hypothetical protein
MKKKRRKVKILQPAKKRRETLKNIFGGSQVENVAGEKLFN